MKGTFTGTGRATENIKGGQNKEGLLWLSFGTGTVELQVSTDNGTTWVTDSSYTTDTSKAVKFLDNDALYTLNCSAYTADIEYSLGT